MMKSKGQKFYLICDNIRSLYNVGSIFRTADAAAVDKIFLCGITPAPLEGRGLREISKVALGAQNWIPWEKASQTWRVIERLKNTDGFWVVALEQSEKSIPYFKFSLPKNRDIALVIGNEVKGLSSKILSRCDQIVEILMYGRKESLNVAVALGIVALEIRNKMETFRVKRSQPFTKF